MQDSFHPVTKQIVELLTQRGYWFETFTHEPVLTSEEAAKTRPGYTLHQGAKAIIAKIQIKGGEEQFVMFVMPADLRLSTKKVKKALNLKGIRFASEDEISTLTNGVQRGAIPPFGNLFSMQIYADPQLFENEKIVFNAGDRRFSIAMKSDDYKTLVLPQKVDISETSS